MSKHTPGPWFQSHRKSVYGGYQTEVYTADGEVVATVAWYPRTLNDKSTTTDREANARLIAAAPDLLAACRTVLMLRQIGGMLPGVREVIDVAIRQAEEAITKATGEQA